MVKKFIAIIAILAAMVGCTLVPPGHVGIKVSMLGDGKGLEQAEVIGVGRYYIGVYKKLYLYPVYQKTYPFTLSASEGSPIDEAFYFQSAEGIKCNVDIGVIAQADPEKVMILFNAYKEDMQVIIKTFLRNVIRDTVVKQASALGVEELYGNGKVKLLQAIEVAVKDKMAETGLIIIGISYLSDIRFPKEVEDAIVGKIRATQEALQRENEVQKARADAEIKIVNAKAEAESIRLRQLVITDKLIQYEAVQKWDGKMPYYMAGGSLPFIQVK